MLSEIYTRVRVRKVALVAILGFIATVLIGLILYASGFEDTRFDLLGLTLFGSIGLLLWLFWGRNCGLKEIFGPWPNQREAWIYLTLGIPIIGVRFLGVSMFFLSLSYVAPRFVAELLQAESSDTFGGSYSLEAILVNGSRVLIAALLVPIVEEIVFRGFILHRWCERYSKKTAVVLSSILFGILHVEILGSVMFAVIVSVVCLRTKSLVGPILIHSGNNFLMVVLLVWLTGGDVETTSEPLTIEGLRSIWWVALVCGGISIPWLYWFVKTRLLGTDTS